MRGGSRAPARLGAVLCSARRTAPRAGTYAITCALGRRITRRLATAAMPARLTTTFRAANGRVTSRSSTLIIRRTPPAYGPESVTG